MSPFKRKLYPVYPKLLPLDKAEEARFSKRKKGLLAAINRHKAINQCRKCGLMKTVSNPCKCE